MNTEKQVRFLNVALQSILYGIVFVLLGQYVGMLETAKYMSSIGVAYAPAIGLLQFTLLKFWIPMIVGAIIGFCIIWFIPVIDWGVKLAMKSKVKPGGLAFSLIVGFVAACIMVPIFAVSMSILTTVVLVPEGEYKATVATALINAARYLWLFFPSAWIFGVIISKPCEKFARSILNVPAPQYGHYEASETEAAK